MQKRTNSNTTTIMQRNKITDTDVTGLTEREAQLFSFHLDESFEQFMYYIDLSQEAIYCISAVL